MTKQEKAWIMEDWANSAYSIAITTAILPVFFKSVVAKDLSSSLSTAYLGYSNSIYTAILAILAPILGAIADYKGYKKKLFTFFLLIGVLSTGLLSIIGEGNWFLCLAIYALSAIGFSGSNIFYDAFLVDVTDDSRMDVVSSYGFGLGYIGSTIPFIVSILFISKPSLIGMDTIGATRLSFIITALWWLVFSLPMLKHVDQKYYIEPSKSPIKESFKRLYDTFKNAKKNRNVFLFLIAYFFYIDGVSTIIKMSTAYGMDIGLSSNTLMIILLVLQIVAFPFAILYGKLAKKFSGKVMILVGIVVYTIICIYAYFIKTALDYWILAILVGSAQGGIQALSRSFFGKIIPKEKSSEFFGIYNIFGRFSAIFGPLMMGSISQITGDSRIGVFSIVALFIIGGLLFLRVKEEDSSTYHGNSANINV